MGRGPGEKTFDEAVQELRQEAFRAVDQQDWTIGELADASGHSRATVESFIQGKFNLRRDGADRMRSALRSGPPHLAAGSLRRTLRDLLHEHYGGELPRLAQRLRTTAWSLKIFLAGGDLSVFLAETSPRAIRASLPTRSRKVTCPPNRRRPRKQRSSERA